MLRGKSLVQIRDTGNCETHECDTLAKSGGNGKEHVVDRGPFSRQIADVVARSWGSGKGSQVVMPSLRTNPDPPTTKLPDSMEASIYFLVSTLNAKKCAYWSQAAAQFPRTSPFYSAT